MNTVTPDDLRELVTPSLRHSGVELVDLQWHRGRTAILRLVIDRPGGVTLDDCERVSIAVGAVLDAYDPIAGRYSLEVSSPGAERPIRSREEWLGALGKRVNVRYRAGEGEAVVEGRLLATADDSVEIEVRDRNRTRSAIVPTAEIIAARIAVDI